MLTESLKNSTHLKVLDLKQKDMVKRDVGPLVPFLAANKTVEKLDISGAIISKINMMHLWLALHKNISVHELIYSRINFFAILEMHAIDAELTLNKSIHDEIMPKFRGKLHTKELSFRNVEVSN